MGCETSAPAKAPKKMGAGKGLKLEYFDLHGRTLSIRMLLWYTNMPFEDERLTFEQFGANKGAGKYPFGSVPELTLPDGKVLYQSLAITRWIARNGKGKMGETLYPGSMNPDQSYDIDNLLEDSNAAHGKSLPLLSDPNSVDPFIENYFSPMLKKCEEYLEKSGGMYLVGDSLTIADIDVGSWLMKLCYNPLNPYKDKWNAALDQYPKTKEWGQKTVQKVYK